MSGSLRRDPASLSRQTFDLAIIGGGIVGACIARDAARRGLSVALIDAADFSSGTSAGSSKLAHGGLRYLQRLELKVVRESLIERARWAANAPHLVRPMPFLFPLGPGALSRAMTRAGLAVYDRLDDAAVRAAGTMRLPKVRRIGRGEAEALEPALAGAAPRGAVLYHEYQVESPERAGLECVIDAVAHGAQAANYVSLQRFAGSTASAPIDALIARDELTGSELEIRARGFVNATGPWADLVLKAALAGPAAFELVRSKGIHLVTRAFLEGHAIAAKHAGRHLFAVPWRGRTLIGTTDTAFDGDPRDVRVEDGEARGMLDSLNAALPNARLSEADVVHRYAAVRPLVGRGESAAGTYGISRDSEIVDHGQGGGPPNLWSVIGGKWTTARLVAEQAVDRIGARLGSAMRPCDTATEPLPHAGTAASAAALGAIDAKVREQLWRSYGSAARRVVEAAGGRAELLRALAPDLPHIEAEMIYAARHEMAETADDILRRRTALAAVGGDRPAIRAMAERALA